MRVEFVDAERGPAPEVLDRRRAGTVLRFGLEPEVFERRERERRVGASHPPRTTAPSTVGGGRRARSSGSRSPAACKRREQRGPPCRHRGRATTPRTDARSWVPVHAELLCARRGHRACSAAFRTARPTSRVRRVRRARGAPRRARYRDPRRRSPRRGAPRRGTPPPTAPRRRSARTRLRSRRAPSGTNHKRCRPITWSRRSTRANRRCASRHGAEVRVPAPARRVWIERWEPPVLPAREERVGWRADGRVRARTDRDRSATSKPLRWVPIGKSR